MPMFEHLDGDFLSPVTLNELSAVFHREAEKWWRDPRTNEFKPRPLREMLMLQVSEIAEAMEGLRKDLKDDHLPSLPAEVVELADFLIRFFDMLGAYRIKFDSQLWDDLNFRAEVLFKCSRPSENLYEIIEHLETFKSVLCDTPESQGWDDRGMFNEEAVASTVEKHRIQYSALCVIRSVEFYARSREFNLYEAMRRKALYNRERADHKHSERIKEGGKKF